VGVGQGGGQESTDSGEGIDRTCKPREQMCLQCHLCVCVCVCVCVCALAYTIAY